MSDRQLGLSLIPYGLVFMGSDGLALHILANAFDPRFAADAALLDASVWREVVDRVNAMCIDPDMRRDARCRSQA